MKGNQMGFPTLVNLNSSGKGATGQLEPKAKP